MKWLVPFVGSVGFLAYVPVLARDLGTWAGVVISVITAGTLVVKYGMKVMNKAQREIVEAVRADLLDSLRQDLVIPEHAAILDRVDKMEAAVEAIRSSLEHLESKLDKN